MGNFIEKNTMLVMIVALAVLLATTIICICIAYQNLNNEWFFCTWLLISITALYAFVKIIKWHDLQEIKNYWKIRQKEKNKTKMLATTTEMNSSTKKWLT